MEATKSTEERLIALEAKMEFVLAFLKIYDVPEVQAAFAQIKDELEKRMLDEFDVTNNDPRSN